MLAGLPYDARSMSYIALNIVLSRITVDNSPWGSSVYDSKIRHVIPINDGRVAAGTAPLGI